MTLVCVTNDMTEIRSCTVKGEHQSNCDGFAYRWNADRERDEYTGRECRGCLPREARHGHLCLDCFMRWESAEAGYPSLSRALLGVDRAVQRDNGGVASSTLGYVPLSGIALMFDELESYHRGATPNTLPGARNAVLFARAYEAAVKSYPIEERAHRIERTRCPRCNHLNLVWNPTRSEGGEVIVKCSNPECSGEFNQSQLEVETMRQVHKVETPLLEGGQPVHLIPEDAEPYQPSRPEHELFDRLMLHTVAELREMARDLDIPKNRSKRELADAIRASREEVMS
jgi:hypothetical protein